MFGKDGINALFAAHRATFEKVLAIEIALNSRFYKMDHATECLMIAAISGESMVMIGPPGTAKSRLIRAFCNLLGLVPDADLNAGEAKEGASGEEYFEYLLTQFTEPSELFGFYDIPKLMKGNLNRLDAGMMQHAKVVFIDEVFNASSAILNALLTFMNERKFHDRGKSHRVPLQLLVGATNHRPSDPSLAAVYDRFLLRCFVHNVVSKATPLSDLTGLLQNAWTETHAAKIARDPSWVGLLDDLAAYRRDVDRMTADGSLAINPEDPLLGRLSEIVTAMTKLDLAEITNRRLIKMSGIILARRMLRGAALPEGVQLQILPEDLHVLTLYSLGQEDPSATEKLRQQLLQV